MVQGRSIQQSSVTDKIRQAAEKKAEKRAENGVDLKVAIRRVMQANAPAVDAQLVLDEVAKPLPPEGDPMRRVHRIVELIQQLDRMVADLSPELPFTGEEKKKEITAELRNLIADTKFVIAPSTGAATYTGWPVTWAPPEGMDSEKANVIGALLRLGEQGLANRLRTCRSPECGQMFYARKKSQRFCGLLHQQMALLQSPEFRANRAAAAKDRRAAAKKAQRRKGGR